MTTYTRRKNRFLQERIVLSFDWPPNLAAVAGAAATGTVTADTNANMADGDKVVLSDGFRTVTYEYDKSANGVAAGNVVWTAGTTAASVATNLATAIAANQPGLSVADNLAGVLTITNRWPGAGGNVTMTKSSASALAVTGMSGGADAATGTSATTTWKFHDTAHVFLLEKAELISPVGLTQDAANYFAITLKNGATVMATWSTQTGQQGTLTANTFKTMVNSAVSGALDAAAGSVLSLVATLTGTQTLPAGRLVVHGRYL